MQHRCDRALRRHPPPLRAPPELVQDAPPRTEALLLRFPVRAMPGHGWTGRDSLPLDDDKDAGRTSMDRRGSFLPHASPFPFPPFGSVGESMAVLRQRIPSPVPLPQLPDTPPLVKVPGLCPSVHPAPPFPCASEKSWPVDFLDSNALPFSQGRKSVPRCIFMPRQEPPASFHCFKESASPSPVPLQRETLHPPVPCCMGLQCPCAAGHSAPLSILPRPPPVSCPDGKP
jgi:hypothetical protein